jgi:hypothetical protein
MRGKKTQLFKHDDKVFRPRRPQKTSACYRQTVPAGSGIIRGSSSTLGVVSTLGRTWPGLGRRPRRRDLHPRKDASTASADVLAKLQLLLPHLPQPGKPLAPGPTKSLSELTPPLSALTPLPPAPAHRRAAEGSKKLSKRGLERQGRPSRGTPMPPGYGYLTCHLPRKATHARLSGSASQRASPSARNEEETQLYTQNTQMFRHRQPQRTNTYTWGNYATQA